jgi:uncharacterized SAM-binding protein YcdF (DUF218 family)
MFLDKLAIALLAPLGTSLALGFLALLAGLLRRRRTAGWLGVLALGWALVWSLPVVSYSLRGLVEAGYPYRPAAAVPEAAVAVVLGGGIDPPASATGPPNLNAAADLVLYAARLYHAGRAPLLLVSGGHDPTVSAASEAAVMREILLALGVPATAILLERFSRNTRQNASFSAGMLREREVTEVLLVTSALHMRRAKRLFEAKGLSVIPAATDHEARSRFAATDWLPAAHALDGSGRAIKEVVGYLVVR